MNRRDLNTVTEEAGIMNSLVEIKRDVSKVRNRANLVLPMNQTMLKYRLQLWCSFLKETN